MSFKIVTLCGSLRQSSFNQSLLGALPALAPADWTFQSLAGLGDMPLYNQDIEEHDGFPGPVQRMAEAIRSADGLVIATPEYNYGPPGVLKNAIDWLSRVEDQPFEGKPVSLMSASPSPMGGIRGQMGLRPVFVALKALVTARPEVAVASAHERFRDGALAHEQTEGVISDHLAMFGDLMAMRGNHRPESTAK